MGILHLKSVKSVNSFFATCKIFVFPRLIGKKTRTNMKKKVMKWYLPTMLVCVMSITVGCSVGDEDAFPDIMEADKGEMISNSIYEGEWSVNKQVVDTARMVVSGSVSVRLPESYLLGLLQTDGLNSGLDKAAPEPTNKPTKIRLTEQGYSDKSVYMAFDVYKTDSYSFQQLYCSCSFEAVINGSTCTISLLSKEYASAVFQQDAGQWTLAVPVIVLSITDRGSGEHWEVTLPVSITLYYNTKTRIG